MFTRHLLFKFFLFILMTLIASIITFSKKKHWGKKNMLPSTLDMAPSPSKWNPRPSTLDPRQKDRLTTDKAQAFEPSRPTDFGVWSSYPLPNQLSASNGIPSLIELSLLLPSVNYGGYLLQKKKTQILIFFTAISREELDSVGNTRLLLMLKWCLFQ